MLQSLLKKASGAALLMLVSASGMNSRAATFTAVASGNFNAASTWGGVAPASSLTSDVIIIPAGLTVTLTDMVTFSGSSSLTVLGSLSSVSGGDLIMTSGDLSGAGSIDVDSLSLGLSSGMYFAGNIMARNLTSTGVNISSAANVYVRNTLRLTAGSLSVASGKLSMAEKSTIEVSGGMLTYSSPGMLNLDSTYNVVYLSGASSTGLELYGDGLDSVTVKVSGTLNLSDDVELNSVLSLQSGMLSLNNKSLTLGADADIATGGSGTISGSAFSNLTVKTMVTPSGSLRFTSGSNVLNNLTINTGSGTTGIMLGSNLNVNGTLSLLSGKIMLGSNDLYLNAGSSVTGGSANSYVQADGSGRLMANLAAGSNATFMVGTATDYTPIMVAANTSSVTSDVGVSVNGSVMANGTSGSVLSATQPMVKNTWYITSSAASGINFDLTAMWNSTLEVNAFNRTQAYISHYTGGMWDVASPAAATSVSGGMYAMTRTGITSLSPFMVTDKDAITTSVKEMAQSVADITIFPAPANDAINIRSSKPINEVAIFNMEGKLVKTAAYTGKSISVSELPAGLYMVQLTGDEVREVRRIEKQ
ncbi:T9SS type A sorting domain-containing protein [Rurimicrobium arvi]|uniref:Secretion system C-terminal sorting domain-containing protein n=1 Tax=Rurimicrobium arvi TaxID=2049916 RepID=A0ABP8MNE0_9BACT